MKKLTLVFLIGIISINSTFPQATTIKKGDVTITSVLRPQQNANEKGQYKYIVQFKEDCYLKSKTNVPFYLARKQEFENDVNTILSSKGGLSLNQIETEEFYYKSFFGASLRCKQEFIEEIKKLDYVKSVSLDYVRKINITESLDLLNIPSVWEDYGVLGDSVKIGIFDTGIDWTHPDLGGGFGQGYKVVGGANFVNPYASPMDDHGHGTHVAGIAAANGTIKGVAPNALLIACKVLNAEGEGYDSDILEAIEYAIDPNNDNNTEDKLDIVNMSFGGLPYENDPLPTAISNAIEEGVIFCIAAGNEYNYYSINSPGTTTEAITIGNIDKNFNIAISSSKGPTFDYTIKPDIVAIGTNVNSTFPNNSYVTASGTSMSTPMVTGACALLKQLHPDWNPDEIKSALVNIATKLETDVMAQGNGVMNIHKAAQVSTTISPALLNFGKIIETNNLWTTFKTLRIHNYSNVQKTYDVEILNENIGIAIEPEEINFIVNPESEKELKINLNLYLSELSQPNESSNSFEGYIYLKSLYDTLRVPWACVKANIIYFDIEYPELLDNYQIFHACSKSMDYDNLKKINDTLYSEDILPGTYNILLSVFQFDSVCFTIIKENIDLIAGDTIELSYKEAKNKITIKGVDESGNILIQDQNYISYVGILFDDSINFDRFEFGLPNQEMNFYISDFGYNTELYSYEALNDTQNKSFKLVFHDHISTLYSDTIFSNNKNNMVKQNINLLLRKDIKDNEVEIVLGSIRFNNLKRISIGYGWGIAQYNPLNNIFKYEVVISSNEYERMTAYYQVLYNRTSSFNESVYPIRAYNNGISVFRTYKALNSTYLSHSEDTLHFGNGLVRILASYNNSSGRLIIDNKIIKGLFEEMRFSDYENSSCKIKNENNETVFDGFLSDKIYLDVPNESYYVQILDTFIYINGIKGSAELNNKINLNQVDKNPPVLSLIEVRNSEGKPISKLHKNETGFVYVSTYDVNENTLEIMNADSMKLFYKYYDSNNWKEIIINGHFVDSLFEKPWNKIFYSYIDENLTNKDSSAIDIKINTSDASGNTLEYILKPAVTIGKMQAPFIYPIANADTFYVKENQFLAVEKEEGILANDEGEAPFNLYASLNRTTLHGTLELNLDGSFFYQPDTNYFGQDDFYYYAHNQKEELKSQLTKVVIVVEEGNDIEEVANNQFSVFPNPFLNEITIHLNTENICNVIIEVYDVQGRKLSQLEKPFSNQIKLTKTEMNIKAEGAYFIEIHAGNQNFTNKIFYKK